MPSFRLLISPDVAGQERRPTGRASPPATRFDGRMRKIAGSAQSFTSARGGLRSRHFALSSLLPIVTGLAAAFAAWRIYRIPH